MLLSAAVRCLLCRLLSTRWHKGPVWFRVLFTKAGQELLAQANLSARTQAGRALVHAVRRCAQAHCWPTRAGVRILPHAVCLTGGAEEGGNARPRSVRPYVVELGHKEELGFVEDPCPGSGSGPWHTCVPRAAPASVAVAHGCPGGGRDQAAARTPYALEDVITRCWDQAAARSRTRSRT